MGCPDRSACVAGGWSAMTTSYSRSKTQQEAEVSPPSSISVRIRRFQKRRALIISVGRVLFLACLLLLWQLLSDRLADPLVLSSPLAVWGRFHDWVSDGASWYSSTLVS